MGFKDLIFKNSDEGNENKQSGDAQKSFKSKFPTSTPQEEPKKETAAPVATATPTVTMGAITPDNPACAPHLDKIMDLYEKGFDGLNMDGYDFYEYFKGVIGVGINQPTSYTMALTMAKSMDPTVSKTSLIEQSQHYISEINRVHETYVNNGNTKREEALKAKGLEESTLSSELTQIDKDIEKLTKAKAEKQAALAGIDAKYSPNITEVECKLMANDIARDRIIGTIQQVVTGINNNL